MMHRDVLALITIDDIADSELRDIARRIGIEAFFTLLEEHGGGALYLPNKLTAVAPNVIPRFIELHRGTYSMRQMAAMLRISQSSIYRLLGESDGSEEPTI